MKRLLLDTHTLIWWITDDPSLGKMTRSILSKGTNSVFVSAVTPWEISIKRALGKLKFNADFDIIMEKNNFIPLSITHAHAESAGDLPRHHGDPFDRMLIVQSQMEGLTLVSADTVFSEYGIRIINARL
ncbi:MULTISPECIES: type II toxin-antitoxin system VapC family toxin [Xenorhabdus]|uniref:Type II toxin-antitoxin system VapC family toxin n=1 Tax=Xenorhabdus griffiniae TaxID=351672 RepID=A0ABY9XIC4_9GAMM|nr:type II toxin-antitoxin system VapC family toxin [Xenorhabdus griffiniae]MBD1227334.1 type II toxin-antitoxin system VapC family toxin [Xenorhabdus griffiniae]MBE8586725.1 type II toxin-antitoxin system VapC family toxin [Xenorhabdus griffiniae]MDC9603686.1 type II toxin-antitoxin system VapC family toxin [Xenorhabdus griffiniae]WMV72689.1 type II toxin-antitoxin system VapC family toxin [Xenorhabdus griffiniae]WNH02367.1 type II toxin-antitoxin system VapC family toxin [Xenorhabdus griffin